MLELRLFAQCPAVQIDAAVLRARGDDRAAAADDCLDVPAAAVHARAAL
jgi:hypothetical protein